MKVNLFRYIYIVVCLVYSINLGAQTGVTYFEPSDNTMPNGKIIGILENNDQSLTFISLISDPKYIMHELDFYQIKPTAEILKNKALDVENLYDLTNLIKQVGTGYTIFGNTSLNNNYEPFQLNINNQGEINSFIQLPQVYSTVICDALSYDNNFMLLYSKTGKNDLYNISLHKVNAETGNVEWLKKISSENNEEADKILITKNGNFYILGKKYNDEVTEYVPIIYKLDKNGNKIWKKAIDVPTNFNKQSFLNFENEELIYICGYTKNPTGISETKVIKLSDTGDEISSNTISDFSANGIVPIGNDKFLLFGSKFIIDVQQVVTKGKFVIINSKLDELMSKSLDDKDKPDVMLQNNIKTSSDFLCARSLSNHRIAIGGRVYMPISSLNNEKFNVPLLLIVNSNGDYDR